MYMDISVKVLATQSWLTLCDTMDCSPQGSSVRGILQARRVEWGVEWSGVEWSVHCLLQGIFQTQGSNSLFPHLPSEPCILGKNFFSHIWANIWTHKNISQAKFLSLFIFFLFPFCCLFFLIALNFYKKQKQKKKNCESTSPLKFSLPLIQNSSKRLFLPLSPIPSLFQSRSYSSYHNQVCWLYLLFTPHLFCVFVILSLKSFLVILFRY